MYKTSPRLFYTIISISTIMTAVSLFFSTADLGALVNIGLKNEAVFIPSVIPISILRFLADFLQILLNAVSLWSFHMEKPNLLAGSVILGCCIGICRGFLYNQVLVTRVQPQLNLTKWIHMFSNPVNIAATILYNISLHIIRVVWVFRFMIRNKLWFLVNKTFLKVSLSRKIFWAQVASVALLTILRLSVELYNLGQSKASLNLQSFLAFPILSCMILTIALAFFLRESFLNGKKSLQRLQKFYILFVVFQRLVHPFITLKNQGLFILLLSFLFEFILSIHFSWCYFTVYVLRKHKQAVENGQDFESVWFNSKYEIPVLSKSQVSFGSVVLGTGNTSEVFRGSYVIRKKEIPVAVKIISVKTTPKLVVEEELQNMTRVMKAGKHDNLIKFFGACFHEVGSAFVVMELCEHGSLKSFLPIYHLSGNPELSQLRKWCVEVASGMQRVAAMNLIHGDLSARNILIAGNNLIAKVSDFGMSRKLYAYESYTTLNQNEFPWKWMAPEILESLKFTKEGDIWAYGVLLWEIYSLGQDPWPGLNWTSDFVQTLKGGIRLSKPELVDDDEHVTQIMTQCWELECKQRPSFDQILTRLATSDI